MKGKKEFWGKGLVNGRSGILGKGYEDIPEDKGDIVVDRERKTMTIDISCTPDGRIRAMDKAFRGNKIVINRKLTFKD